MTRLRLTAILTALSGAVFLAKGLWIPLKAELAYGLMDRALAQQTDFETVAKPWYWADFGVLGKLTVGKEVIHVLDRATNQALAFGAGRHEEYPAAGPFVLSGHRDTHFSVLESTREGDPVAYETRKGRTLYRVTDTRIFDLREGVLLPPGPDQMMLITCWPFDGIDPDTSKRFIVLAETTGSTSGR